MSDKVSFIKGEYINREYSWLMFNRRVIAQATDSTPFLNNLLPNPGLLQKKAGIFAVKPRRMKKKCRRLSYFSPE